MGFFLPVKLNSGFVLLLTRVSEQIKFCSSLLRNREICSFRCLYCICSSFL